ncbi:MAG: winged helix-turn-helix domain-containing protein [Bifidobacteriaceae bacterium]|jgi:DNA-binding response OmpR family regulator|nr:winged helix-turn-helix domain-containing protein [Bifidobacteriaceae bacterium]
MATATIAPSFRPRYIIRNRAAAPAGPALPVRSARYVRLARPAPQVMALSPESVRAAREFQAVLQALPLEPTIRIDLTQRTVHVGNTPVSLTGREFDLLAYLAARPGEAVSREALRASDTSGRQAPPGSRAIDVHIAHLREKLGFPAVIATVHRQGYRFNPSYRVELAQ